MAKSEKSETKSKKSEEVGQVAIISRASWGALPAKSTVPLDPPVKEIIYTDTNTKSCSTKQECTKLVKELQKYHMELKGLPDIEYNFLIGGDGNVYEGRGWHSASSTNENEKAGGKEASEENNEKCLQLAFIGNFNALEVFVGNEPLKEIPLNNDLQFSILSCINNHEGDIPSEMKQVAEGLLTYGIENELVYTNEEDEEADRESDDENKNEQQTNKNQ